MNHELTLKEFKRQENVVDTMLSAQTRLAERYERRSTGLTLVIMALSIVAAGVAFISAEPSVTIGPFSARVQVWVGILGFVIFFLSIVELKVEWRRRAWAHEEAVRRFADLKPHYRQVEIDGDKVSSATDLTAAYNQTWETVNVLGVRIPPKQFNKLKAWHWHKVELSRRISACPQRPLLLHRLDIRLEGIGRKPKRSGPNKPLGPDDRK
jgi:hypothetical protein